MEQSKSLRHDDESGFLFAQEMLDGDVTAAVNFDRFMRHPQKGFIIMEYLLCEEEQMTKHQVSPYTSHPNRYWNKNRRKFLSLWRAALDLHGTLYLVNYARKDTRFENEVLLLRVLSMNEDRMYTEEKKYSRAEFQKWFRNLNRECLGPESDILAKNPIYVRNGYYHSKRSCRFLSIDNDFAVYDVSDRAYYEKLKPCRACYLRRTGSK